MKRRGAKSLKREKQSLQSLSAAMTAAKQGDRLEAMCLHEESVALMAEADELRRVDEVPQLGAGGEALPIIPEGDNPSASVLARETLLHPDAVNVGASAVRLDLVEKADVSELAVDAAQSIQPQNSLEKMLSHQIALCHAKAFETISQAGEQRDICDQVRLLNAGTRLIKAFQEGLLALHKIRTGGKQTVVVQHVNVTDGGQAVVAGTVKGRGSPDGGCQ